MKKATLLFLLLLAFSQVSAQNFLNLQAGYQGTYTAIAEYERIDRHDYLLDSMTLQKSTGFLQAAATMGIDLGSRFYLLTGFHYSRKGLGDVAFTDSTGWVWSTPALQHYAGISLQAGYRLPVGRKTGFLFATGLQADFSVGQPNGGSLFSGPYYRFFMPFSKFNEVDLGWSAEAGFTYRAGPGEFVAKARYLYGLSDVLEDAFVIGRSMSYGVTVGYSVFIGRKP